MNLALWLKKNKYRADQVQTFLPSPMATATAMYHTGVNPLKAVRHGASDKVEAIKGLTQRRLHKGVPAVSRCGQLAGAARGAAAHGPRGSDRAGCGAAGAGASTGGLGGEGCGQAAAEAAGRDGVRAAGQRFTTKGVGYPGEK